MSGTHKYNIVDIDIKYTICQATKTTYTDDGKEKITISYEARPVFHYGQQRTPNTKHSVVSKIY